MKYEEGETFQHKLIYLYQQLSSEQDKVSCGCKVTINEQEWEASKELVSHPWVDVQGKQVQKVTSERMVAIAPPPIQ